jgi:hypothetical protein
MPVVYRKEEDCNNKKSTEIKYKPSKPGEFF